MANSGYEITKGQQYDREGAMVLHGTLCSTYTRDGRLDTGYPVPSEVEEAVRRVVVTGQAETVVLGAPERPVVGIPEMQGCPHYVEGQGCPLHGELCR